MTSSRVSNDVIDSLFKVEFSLNSTKNIANVANMVVDCMEVNPEEACLNALFNSDYFWNK